MLALSLRSSAQVPPRGVHRWDRAGLADAWRERFRGGQRKPGHLDVEGRPADIRVRELP